jgi:hypothetical protein
MIFPSFIGGLSLNINTYYKKMRADQVVVEVIVSAGPVSPMDVPLEFFPMSIEAIDLENMSDLIINEIILSEENTDTDTDSDSDIDDAA